MSSKISTLIAAVVSTAGLLAVTTAVAGVNGPYLGADIGYGFLHQNSVSGLTTTSSKSTGVAGRADAGFQFSEYFSLEAGYTLYSNSSIKGYNADLVGASTTINSYAIDLVIRAAMPIGAGLNIYGKIGPAYLKEVAITTANYSPAFLAANPGFVGGSFRDSDLDSKVFPALAIGAMFDLSNNFAADIQWMHIQRLGDNTLRNADFAGVGLTYNLG